MPIVDVLQKLFSNDPNNAISPDGRPMNSPIVQFLDQMSPPVDQHAENMKALSRGLLDFSKAITSSKQDFGPALVEGIQGGATGYLDAKDATQKKVETHNQDRLTELFGLAKNEDLGQSREASLNYREAALASREAAAIARLGETSRHNRATEDNSTERLGIAKERSILDAKKAQVELDRQGLTGENLRTGIIARMERLKTDKAKSLGLDDPMFSVVDPEGHAKALEEYDTYKSGIEETFKRAGRLDQGGTAPLATASPQAATTAPSGILATPPPMGERVVGKTYQSPKGPVTWTGQGWAAAQ